ncbi:MAG: sulfotransferase [Silicimonas sp.]|nr:sulfotransferase [Silicimonas sp.]
MKKDGIILLGCPRSGTTLLRRLLGAHSNIVASGETYLLSACARFLREDPVAGGINVGVLNGLGFLGYSEDETLNSLRDFAFGFLDGHAKREGGKRWLEKTATNAFHLQEIERLCAGHAQFVCIVRHGLDVASSMLDWAIKAQSVPVEIHHYVKQTPHLLEAFALAWADSNAQLCDFVDRHSDSAILVRYEDVIADPEKSLASILDHLGETMEDELLDTAFKDRAPKGFSDWKTFSSEAVNSKSVDRWKTLPKDTVSMVAPIVNPMLARNGYDVIEASTKHSQEQARKRYLTGLLLQSLR